MDVRRPLVLSLRVASLARALAFWHGRLGIPVKLQGDGWAELQTDTVLVTLVERADGPDVTLGWEVADLGDAAEDLAARGIEAGSEANGPNAPGRRLGFEDPDGHALEIVSPRA